MKQNLTILLVILVTILLIPNISGFHPADNNQEKLVIPQPDSNTDWDTLRQNRQTKAPLPVYEVGDTHVFWTWNLSVMPPGFNQTPCTLRAVGDFCYIWVADDQWNVNIVQANVDSLKTAWEIETPEDSINPENGIYQIATSVFGDPPDELDADDHINLLFYETGSFAGSTFDGFFNVFDQMTEAEAQAQSQHSNECEMLYINSDGPHSVDDPYMLGVLAHEFQHMIHWQADPNEETWMNEGCSQLSWYLCGFGTDGAEFNFAHFPDNDLTTWEQRSGDYGKVTLFTLYIYQQFGGADFIKDLVMEPANGLAGLSNALENAGFTQDINEILDHWMLANYLNSPEFADGQFGYQNFSTPNFKIQNEVSTYPYDSGDVLMENCVALADEFTDWDDYIEFNFASNSDVSMYAAVFDSSVLSRIIPLDDSKTLLQVADPGQTIQLIGCAHNASSSSYNYSAGIQVNIDETPPYAFMSEPARFAETQNMGRIRIIDELNEINSESITMTSNGTPIYFVIEPESFQVMDLVFALEQNQLMDVILGAKDINDNVMTEKLFPINVKTITPDPLGVHLYMPGTMFSAGDPCNLNLRISHPGAAIDNVPVFVLLDVYGIYYSAPAWSEISQEVSYYNMDIGTGNTFLRIIPLFAWPTGLSPADGIAFYAAMTDQNVTELIGEMDIWTFGWN